MLSLDYRSKKDRSREVRLLVIVGPTASGKSALALKIAKEFNGEIITADSRTIYKGMDIGTAKPTTNDQKLVRHWGLDLVGPGETFSAKQFQEYAREAIPDIRQRGKLPILVGGTGLYIDTVLYDFEFRPKAEAKTRSKLEAMTVEELQAEVKKNDWPMPVNSKNKRHLIRTVETVGKEGSKRPKPLKDTLIIGIMPSDEVLRQNIEKRAVEIFEVGVIEETKRVFPKLDERSMVNAGIAYKICAKVIEGEIDESEALELFKKADWQYARRQRTWFRRNEFIHWFKDGEEAYGYISSVLEPST